MEENKMKQYVYLAQSLYDTNRGKIGITDNLEGRLKTFNSSKGKNAYTCLFAGEVRDMKEVDYDTRANFSILKFDKPKDEMFLINSETFKMIVDFIEAHPLFEAVAFKRKEIHYKEPEDIFPSFDFDDEYEEELEEDYEDEEDEDLQQKSV